MARGPCTAPGRDEAYYSVKDIAHFWTLVGGSESTVVAAVAVALAESCGGDANALSPVGARGLWQIMPENAQAYGYTADDMYIPAANASVAVQLSANGTNWRAFDTAYSEGEGLRARRDIPIPEPDSVAGILMPSAALDLGITAGAGAPQRGAGIGVPAIGAVPNPGEPGQVVTPPFIPVVPAAAASIVPGEWSVPALLPANPQGTGWDALTQLWGPFSQQISDSASAQIAQLARDFGG